MSRQKNWNVLLQEDSQTLFHKHSTLWKRRYQNKRRKQLWDGNKLGYVMLMIWMQHLDRLKKLLTTLLSWASTDNSAWVLLTDASGIVMSHFILPTTYFLPPTMTNFLSKEKIYKIMENKKMLTKSRSSLLNNLKLWHLRHLYILLDGVECVMDLKE